MTAIEELEKLASDIMHPDLALTRGSIAMVRLCVESRVMRCTVCAEILALLPRLRAEARERERAAFHAGATWAWVVSDKWPEAAAEASRRYPEPPKEEG